MKKIISALILSLLLCSCVTRQACERRFANAWLESRDGGFGTGADINTTASTNTLTMIRDTTIYVLIPGDTVEGEVQSVPLAELSKLGVTQSSIPQTNISMLNTRLATSTIWLKDGRLHHKLEQKDTIVASIIKGALKTSTTHNQETQTILKTSYVNQLTGWQWTQVYLGRMFLGVLAVIFLWKLVWLQPKSWRNP